MERVKVAWQQHPIISSFVFSKVCWLPPSWILQTKFFFILFFSKGKLEANEIKNRLFNIGFWLKIWVPHVKILFAKISICVCVFCVRPMCTFLQVISQESINSFWRTFARIFIHIINVEVYKSLDFHSRFPFFIF